MIHLSLLDEAEVEAAEALLPPAVEGQEVALMPAASVVPDVAMVDPVLAQAAAIARLPGLSETMFSRLMEWNEKERAAQAEERFNETMNRCQSEIAPVARSSENKQTGSWWAKLEAVDASIRPVYTRHGFAVAYNTVPPLVTGNVRVECEVALGRHSKKYYREAPADTLGPKGSPTKTILHGTGSTETFLKRYAVCAAFNVVFKGLDDDGNAGGARYLDADQIAEIGALVDETSTDPAAFFTTMLTEEVHTYADIPQMHYERIKNALVNKKRAQEKKAPTP